MPSVQAVNPIYTRAILGYLLNLFNDTAAPPNITTVSVRLFTDGPTPITPRSVIADFTACTFPGYAPVLVTAFPTVTTPGELAMAIPLNAFWTFSNPGTPAENVQGYYLVDTDNAALIGGEYFPAPIPLSNVGDFIDLLAFIALTFSPSVT